VSAAKVTAEEFAALEVKHGECNILSDALGIQVVCRLLNEDEAERFLDEREDSKDDQRRRGAGAKLFLSTVVHPSGDALKALLKRKPLMATAFGAKVAQLAGLTAEIAVGKAEA
jgi:hypothetical protein